MKDFNQAEYNKANNYPAWFVCYAVSQEQVSSRKWVAIVTRDEDGIEMFRSEVPKGRNTRGDAQREALEIQQALKDADKEAGEKLEAAEAKDEAKDEEAAPKKKNDWSARNRAVGEGEIECTNCHDMLGYGDFYSDKSNKNGVMNWCKGCLKDHRATKKAEKDALEAAASEAAAKEVYEEDLPMNEDAKLMGEEG